MALFLKTNEVKLDSFWAIYEQVQRKILYLFKRRQIIFFVCFILFHFRKSQSFLLLCLIFGNKSTLPNFASPNVKLHKQYCHISYRDAGLGRGEGAIASFIYLFNSCTFGACFYEKFQPTRNY